MALKLLAIDMISEGLEPYSQSGFCINQWKMTNILKSGLNGYIQIRTINKNTLH